MPRSKVFQARNKSSSIKGTIPSDVASALKLKDNDTLEWELVAEGGEIVAKVRKAANPLLATKGKGR